MNSSESSLEVRDQGPHYDYNITQEGRKDPRFASFGEEHGRVTQRNKTVEVRGACPEISNYDSRAELLRSVGLGCWVRGLKLT